MVTVVIMDICRHSISYINMTSTEQLIMVIVVTITMITAVDLKIVHGEIQYEYGNNLLQSYEAPVWPQGGD